MLLQKRTWPTNFSIVKEDLKDPAAKAVFLLNMVATANFPQLWGSIGSSDFGNQRNLRVS